MTTVNTIGVGLSGASGTGSFAGTTAPTMSNVTIDNLNIHTNTISSSSGDVNLAPNNATTFGSDTYIGLGQNVQIASNSENTFQLICGYSNDLIAPTLGFLKSANTTVGSHTAVVNNTELGVILAYGDDGTGFYESSAMIMAVDGSVSSGIVPGKLILQTANTSGTLTTALTINNAQQSSFTGLVSAQTSFTANSPTPGDGSLSLTCVNNGGNYANVLTNAATSAAQTWTLPDATGTIALTSSASGIVNPGLINQIAYYASAGTTLSGLSTANNGFLITSPSGVPSISNSIQVFNDQSGYVSFPGTSTLNILTSGDIIYPSPTPFLIVLGSYSEVLANTSQTIDTGTYGTNCATYGNFSNLRYTDNGTNDLSALELFGSQNAVNWNSTNTCGILFGSSSSVLYQGTDVGMRTATSITGSWLVGAIEPFSSTTATVGTLYGSLSEIQITHDVNTNITQSTTSAASNAALVSIQNTAANNSIAISELHNYDAQHNLDTSGAGSTLSITNLYGLRLRSPIIVGSPTITNRYGISQEDASAQNVFAGTLTFPTMSSVPPASQSSSLAIGSAFQNVLGYDVVLTVYLSVTAATADSISLGVGPTNTPTQQVIISGLTIAAGFVIIPVTIYLPSNYYALLTVGGSVTATISGQQAMPV